MKRLIRFADIKERLKKSSQEMHRTLIKDEEKGGRLRIIWKGEFGIK